MLISQPCPHRGGYTSILPSPRKTGMPHIGKGGEKMTQAKAFSETIEVLGYKITLGRDRN